MSTIYAINKDDFYERALYENEQNVPLNVAGHTSYIRIAKFYGSAEVDVVTINGVIEAPSTNGVFVYTAPASTFANLDYGTYVYSRYLKNASNEVKSIVTGSFVLIPAV